MIFLQREPGSSAHLWRQGPVFGPQASTLDYQKVDIGAGEEIRTLDPNLGKVVLYH